MMASPTRSLLQGVARRPELHADDSSGPDSHNPGVVGAGMWTLVAVGSNGVSRLLTVMMVARASGVDSVGDFTTGLAIAQMMVLFLPTALGSAASKFLAQGRATPGDGHPAEVFRFIAGRLRLVALVLTLVAAAVTFIITGGQVFGAIQVAVLTWVLCWYSVVRGSLFGLGLARRSAFWDITTSVFTIALVAVILAMDQVDHGAILAVAAAYALFAVMNLPRGAVGLLSGERRKEIDRFCVAVLFGTLASTGFLQLTMIVSRVVGGREAAGYFGAALTFATPVSLLAASLSLVLFPELAAAFAKSDHVRVAMMVDRAFRVLMAITVPVFAVTQFLAEPVLSIFLGKDFAGASQILVILVAAVLLTTIGIPAVAALTSGNQRGVQASAIISGAGLVLGATSWTVLVPALAVNGVAWGYLFGSALIAAGPIGWAWRTQHQRWAVPVVSTVGAFLALVLIRPHSGTAVSMTDLVGAGAICLVWAVLQLISLRSPRKLVRVLP